MKAVFIVYNQALTERVQQMLDKLNVRGFSQWQDVKGRGSETGEPHMGTHTWPAMNSATITIVEDHMVARIMEKVALINETAQLQGIRAFSWQIEQTI